MSVSTGSITSIASRESSSAVSWSAILAGAAAAAALSLILLILGTGLGLSSISPWSNQGIAALTFGVSTILWITVTQIVASGLGGYIAGRLRTRWLDTNHDEVFFRDTAHGFLAWAVASIVTAALLTSAVSTIVGGAAKAGASLMGNTATSDVEPVASKSLQPGENLTTYFLDLLFRSPGATTDRSRLDAAIEVNRIFINAIQSNSMAIEDTQYVAQLVVQRTGVTQAEAERRVTDTFVRIQKKIAETQASVNEATNKARKASAYAALWLFISLLLGAFAASYAATFGGRQRDTENAV